MNYLEIKLYDKVKLRSGEIGYIVEIYEHGKAYEIELIDKGFEDRLRTINHNDILEVIKK